MAAHDRSPVLPRARRHRGGGPVDRVPEGRDVAGDFQEAPRLSVEIAEPDDPREIEPFLAETLGPDWGLHLIDANVAQDNLIAVVEQQAASHRG